MRKRGETGGARSESERKEEARNVVHKGVEADSSKRAREPKKKQPEKRYGRDGENGRDLLQIERTKEREKESGKGAQREARCISEEREGKMRVCTVIDILQERGKRGG